MSRTYGGATDDASGEYTIGGSEAVGNFTHVRLIRRWTHRAADSRVPRPDLRYHVGTMGGGAPRSECRSRAGTRSRVARSRWAGLPHRRVRAWLGRSSAHGRDRGQRRRRRVASAYRALARRLAILP